MHGIKYTDVKNELIYVKSQFGIQFSRKNISVKLFNRLVDDL